MKTRASQPVRSDASAIRALLAQWAAATRENRTGDILAGHEVRATIFDVLAPLQYKGAAAYRRSWGDWQPPFAIPSLFELCELKITVGGAAAFAHAIIRCGGKLPSGEQVEDLVRATFCLRKTRGAWRVHHQHISMPMAK